MNSDAELPPGVTPSPERSAEEWAGIVSKAMDNATRLPLEAAVAEEADTRAFMGGLMAKAEAEIAAWQALPCHGELEQVTACTPEVYLSCERNQHVMCPRQQLSRAAEQGRDRKSSERRRLVEGGCSERALKAVFDSEPLKTPALEVLQAEFMRQPPITFLVLSGGVGCGKTCAATWWATKYGAKVVTAADFGRLSPYDGAAESVIRAPRLVLDDLGLEYLDPKGFFLANLDALILYRDANNLQTVITTNLKAKDFADRYGARVADRIAGGGSFKLVAGGSLRGAK